MNFRINPQDFLRLLNEANERGYPHSLVQIEHAQPNELEAKLLWEADSAEDSVGETVITLHASGQWSAELVNIDILGKEDS